MGIHNEPGSERVTTDLVGLVKKMLAQLLNTNDKDRAFSDIQKGDEVVLLVNNLGGVSVLELGGITDEVVGQLRESWGIEPVRILAGTFMTSLNGLGFSVSLLKLKDTGLGKGRSMLELLDAPAEAVGWSAAVRTSTWGTKRSADAAPKHAAPDTEEARPSGIKSKSPFFTAEEDSHLTNKQLTLASQRKPLHRA
jgi:triose/dihydroxyacetone kinase / FAD-AMP lyase (cyclizing)